MLTLLVAATGLVLARGRVRADESPTMSWQTIGSRAVGERHRRMVLNDEGEIEVNVVARLAHPRSLNFRKVSADATQRAILEHGRSPRLVLIVPRIKVYSEREPLGTVSRVDVGRLISQRTFGSSPYDRPIETAVSAVAVPMLPGGSSFEGQALARTGADFNDRAGSTPEQLH